MSFNRVKTYNSLIMALDSKVPAGAIADKWTKHKGEIPLVSPANKRLLDIIVVGTGLAGSSEAASFADLRCDWS